MKNATNVENTIFVTFEFLKHNIEMDERKQMWSKVLIKNLKIDIIITIKKKEVIFLITENNNLEFKRELTDSIIKEIIAINTRKIFSLCRSISYIRNTYGICSSKNISVIRIFGISWKDLIKRINIIR